MTGQALKEKKGQQGLLPAGPFCLQCCSLALVLPNAQLSLVGFGIALAGRRLLPVTIAPQLFISRRGGESQGAGVCCPARVCV